MTRIAAEHAGKLELRFRIDASSAFSAVVGDRSGACDAD